MMKNHMSIQIGKEISPELILCVTPLSERIFPSITPKAIINIKDPSVLPILCWNEFIISAKSIPWAIPTKREAIINERKAFSFTAEIKTSNKSILIIKINIDLFLNLKFHFRHPLSYL